MIRKSIQRSIAVLFVVLFLFSAASVFVWADSEAIRVGQTVTKDLESIFRTQFPVGEYEQIVILDPEVLKGADIITLHGKNSWTFNATGTVEIQITALGLKKAGDPLDKAEKASIKFTYSIEQVFTPTFTKVPADATAWEGQSVSFHAAASGAGTISYKWYFSTKDDYMKSYISFASLPEYYGVTCSGDGTDTLTLNNINKNLDGYIVWCVAQNNVGATSSPFATVHVKDHEVSVGGVPVENGYYRTDSSGTVSAGTAANYNIRYEAATHTLTLQNATIKSGYIKGANTTWSIRGIYAAGDLTLVLNGTNTVTMPLLNFQNGAYVTNVGIQAKNLHICGAGDLTVTAGDAKGTSCGIRANQCVIDAVGTVRSVAGTVSLADDTGSAGILAEISYVQNSGTVYATGGNVSGSNNLGIYAPSFSIKGGTLTAKAGFGGVGAMSVGVYAPNYLEFSGGTSTASGEFYALWCSTGISPVIAENASVLIGDTADATSTSPWNPSSMLERNYPYARIDASQNVYAVNVAGVTEPKLGEIPSVTGIRTDLAGAISAVWYRRADKESAAVAMTDGEPFEENVYYSLVLTYTPDEKLTLHTPLTATVNGKTAAVSDGGNAVQITIEFAPLQSKPAVVLGDVDGDTSITSTDARLVLQYYAKKIGADKLDLAAADVDGDGDITSTDARLILQYYAKKITEFPTKK